MRPPPPPPPPPPAADTYQRPPPSLPPQPPNHPWPYPSPQFQYQSQTHQRSSPPPPQWPPPHSAEHAPYPSHPPHYPPCQPPPYAAHPHYPPSHPPPPRPPRTPQSDAQDWGSGSWSQQQSWQYPTHKNEEDWLAKAKAWLAAKAATENQHPSSQFAPAGRLENHLNHFRDQYSQSNDPQFHDVPTPEFNYQQYPGSVGPPNRMPLSQFQGSQYISSGKSSYATDMHDPFDATDGTLTGASLTPLNPLIHQQEVPSSYSSVAGKEEAGDRYEKFNSSSSLPVGPLSQHHVQPLPPEGGRSGWMEEPHNFGSVSAESASDLSNQLLSFPPQFKHNLDSHAQPKYTHSSGVPVRGGEPSNYAWTPSMAQGPVYPPMPPPIPLGVQVDNPITMSSAPMFLAGSGFQPTVPMIGAAFGVGAGVTPPAEFSGDAYGYSERPKKASVPNWLREERIKNKAVFTSSAPEIPKEDSQSIDEDSIDKSYRKGYLLDSKSVDSLRSTESDDEHEDEVETSRTVAINQEIKRVLTEFLLKVTDELFDEIATKVLNEDDLSVDVGRDVDSSNHQIPTESVLTPNASAKVLIPMKNKESDHKDASEKSTSAPTGDVLGLGSYVSDEDDDEIQSSGKLNSKEISLREQTSSSKPSEVHSVNENGGSPDSKEQQAVPAKLEMDGIGTKSILSANIELIDHKADGDSESSNDPIPSKTLSMITENELQHVPDFSNLNKSLVEKAVERSEDHNSAAGRLMNDDFGFQEPGNRYDRNERLESKKSLTKRDPKNSESSNEKLYKNGDEEHGGHSITERTYYHGNSKDKGKKKSRTDEKVNHTGSRKQISPSGRTEGTTETHRNKRTSGLKDNNSRRKDRTGDEKRERSRHKSESESGRHKRHRSSSRGRGNKDNSVVSRANASSDESSDDSRRKSHHSKRRKSPSPSTTRKRPPPITASTIRRAA